MKKLIYFICIFISSALIAEPLSVDVISYDLLIANDETAVSTLIEALHTKGIVGVQGVPGYRKKVKKFVDAARGFCALPESTKEKYAPNRELGDLFLGYEKGKEKFKRPDGSWVTDDLKISYYAFVPENSKNRWPLEIDLNTPFEDLGVIMADTAQVIMEKIGLTGQSTGIHVEDTPKVGRMLYYQKREDTSLHNPYWCGAHFDHGLFTALTPATYYVDGELVPEPEEAGLFVNVNGEFKKIVADSDLMLFQVGEFGQLVANDKIMATEHRVHKANSPQVERFAMALFFEAPMDTVIHSTSALTKDSRYGGTTGDPCTYQHWTEESFKRYIVN